MTKFESNKFSTGLTRWFSVATLLLLLLPAGARADIQGIEDASFNLTASAGYISVADGASIYSWGYSNGSAAMQLPGPTLIVIEGIPVTVILDNALPSAAGNVSIVFPGQEVTADDTTGAPGLLTREAPSGGSVTYTFTPSEPGTYQYHSGTQPDLQVEMGLYGALIVVPDATSVTTAACASGQQPAYGHAETCFDREYLFLLSEIDLQIHQAAEDQASGAGPIVIPLGEYASEYWLINGRAAPDTMAGRGRGVMTHQPYNSFPRMHPGDRLLMRVVGAGRDSHPFHHHGNHARVLARDGRMLLSATDATKLAGPLLFTIPTEPGSTTDSIFEWTGKDLGWDIYGHQAGGIGCVDGDGDGYDDYDGLPAGDANNDGEWCADHNVAIPVELPALSSMTFGGFYSGSPYLGGMGSLPPGEGGLNPNAGFAYMWHSHTEKEIVNNDVFPGGMLTMLIIEPPSVTITD
jgi:FtsP/CotA-like multicopper oxidase with cupredoxin domain